LLDAIGPPQLRCALRVESMNLFADTIAPVRRSAAGEMFLLRFVAKPFPQNPESSSVGGAYVNCWVDVDDLRTAEEKALEAMAREQWKPTKFDHWELVCRQCYIKNPDVDEDENRESLQRLNEALEHGIALTFNCWPPDAPDANEDPDA